MAARDILIPPAFCHYADGPCDQTFEPPSARQLVFLAYPSEPDSIAYTVEAAAERLRQEAASREWLTWKDLQVSGQLIFCRICMTMRRSMAVVADITTLNFNLMFEIGYAIGLGLMVLPIRDPSVIRDAHLFKSIGIFDTLGYEEFANSDELAKKIRSRLDGDFTPIETDLPGRSFRETPIYLVRSPVNTEGELRIISTLKKSGIRFRTYDPNETPRMSFGSARRQVNGSYGVILNLLSEDRAPALTHNALSALIAGYALARNKLVLLLHEGPAPGTPIDYRDLVKSYANAGAIPTLMQPLLHGVVESLQRAESPTVEHANLGLLKDLDIGDIAAENEIGGLKSYFMTTGQSIQARQGHARLVTGRKGSGKTAIFYEVRTAEQRGRGHLVLDLRPEGPQFTRLREFVSESMSPGLQEHTLVAFWTYILLTEIVRKVLDQHRNVAKYEPTLRDQYNALEKLYREHDPGPDSDFSQRLLLQVERIRKHLEGIGQTTPSSITEIIFAGDIRTFRDSVVEYLRELDSVWLLIDNLDKSWPIRGATGEDLLILRSLLDATRKLQQMIEERGPAFRCLVFLRSDIYDQLVHDVPDKGKDTEIRVEWDDPEAFKQLICLRIDASLGLDGKFDDVWTQICTPLVGPESSFGYIVERTLMRPRDLLQFLHHILDVAINRGHEKISAEDIAYAEKAYSEDMLLALGYEITDTHPELSDVLYAFQGANANLSLEDARFHLIYAGLVGEHDASKARSLIDLLISYGFFGVKSSVFSEVRYAFNYHGDLRRLMLPLEMADATLVIHPAFQASLEVGAS